MNQHLGIKREGTISMIICVHVHHGQLKSPREDPGVEKPPLPNANERAVAKGKLTQRGLKHLHVPDYLKCFDNFSRI